MGYYTGGHILQPRRQGNALKARCVGSEDQPYRVQVNLDERGIASASCTCYVGAGGQCKHAAALLLTWLHEPERFQEQASLDAALEARSKPELVALIQRMLNRYPDLESLLEVPLVIPGDDLPPLDAEGLEKQVQSAFYGGDDWGPNKVIPEELEELARLGDAYAEQERWSEAATIYWAVLDAILSYDWWDAEGTWALIPIADDCVYSLGECLRETQPPGQREPILRALFEAYRWTVEHSNVEMASEAPFLLLEHATAEEKARIAGWVRDAMPSPKPTGDSWSANYVRQAYGAFLLDLEGEEVDDETFLRVCRETGRWRDLVDRLLALGRVDEAADITREREDTSDLLALADLLIEHGHAPLAEELVRERAASSRDWRFPEWLKKRAKARGNLTEALSIAETQFWQRPNIAGYQEMRDLAQQAAEWEARRGALLARLGDKGHHRLLAEIHLEEGEIDRALETLGQVLASRWGWAGDLAIRVAEAAEETRPRAALHLYHGRRNA